MAGEMIDLMFVSHGYVILQDAKTNSKSKIFNFYAFKKISVCGIEGETY